MTQIVTEPRTTEERAARLREFYEADCAILGIPPYDSPLESQLADTGVAAVLQASGLPLGTDAAERASLTALASPAPF